MRDAPDHAAETDCRSKNVFSLDWPILVILALLIATPIVSAALDDPFLVRLVTRGIIFAMVAVALNFVLGFGGLVSLMHAGIFGVGAYTVAILAFHDHDGTKLLEIIPGSSNVFISIPVAIVIAALVTACSGIIALRTSGAYFIMITLAFNQMLYYFFSALRKYGGEDGLQIFANFQVLGFDFSNRNTFFYFVLAVLTIELFIVMRLVDSPFGITLQAIAQNERRAIAMGIPTLRFKFLALVISGAFAGLAGALWATNQQYVSPSDLSWIRSADYIVMAVLGGMTRTWGPVIGALMLVLLEAFLPTYTQYWQIPLGLFVIVIVVCLKGGIVDLVDKKSARGRSIH
jgi:branched-chain amino acid transport system permease protein